VNEEKLGGAGFREERDFREGEEVNVYLPQKGEGGVLLRGNFKGGGRAQTVHRAEKRFVISLNIPKPQGEMETRKEVWSEDQMRWEVYLQGKIKTDSDRL